MSYRNRIIASGIVSPKELIANPKNWRRHPVHQKEVLDEVLSTVGWVQEVIVNKDTGLIVDGHLRVELAISKGESEIPVKYVSLSAKEEATILATIDPIAALAETDKNAIQELADFVNPKSGSDIALLLDSLVHNASIDAELMQSVNSEIDVPFSESSVFEEKAPKQPAVFFNVSEDTKKKWMKMWFGIPLDDDEEKALAIIRIMAGEKS